MRVVNLKIVVWGGPIVVLATLICLHYLDFRLASYVMELLNSSTLFKTTTSNIPDVLFILVCFVCCILWGCDFMLRRQGRTSVQLRFCQIAGISVPLAFLLRWPLKVVFGRTNTRIALANQSRGNFHWFHGGGDFSSFPSGHMMVFAAFFTALWLFYPGYRIFCVVVMLALAVALVVTDYHFLSDVIVGGYIGLITTVLTEILFRKTSRLDL